MNSEPSNPELEAYLAKFRKMTEEERAVRLIFAFRCLEALTVAKKRYEDSLNIYDEPLALPGPIAAT